ncbi:hypothetical protein MGYG_04909 [Nannizzia gypsea CBS 118893]|uniref:Uncharacterized protein n=1 Tax=Arthroderma gypseum (strain ATCC MYA-4604 / CBS 118893) TaxID=535722 RepID=E4UXG1_ARTGP|nr:hypothetical protein MGYG_04909 [Nannizzia gypsea CBS 118893]EFR01909.1 hypothetical protein MGYG_04909 [Nannizzia gypsea CBS 118893]
MGAIKQLRTNYDMIMNRLLNQTDKALRKVLTSYEFSLNGPWSPLAVPPASVSPEAPMSEVRLQKSIRTSKIATFSA